MQTSHGVRFGHKVWADIQVLEKIVSVEVVQELKEEVVLNAPIEFKVEEEIVYPELPKPEFDLIPELIQGQPIMSAFADEELYEMPAGDKVCEAPLNESQFLKNMMTPFKAYMNEVEKVTDKDLKSALNQLYEFGFVDFNINKKLMEKYHNVDQVAGILCENSLTKSTFSVVFGK